MFQPECTGAYVFDFNALSVANNSTEREPFYASTSPQLYAIAAATVISWMLVIMLIITPRTFLVGGPAGSGRGLGGRGIIAGASSRSTSIVGVGSRPWLQKVAALTVAVSLTIATSDTFIVAERQYHTGFMNASDMRAEVASAKEIRIVRVISDVFLWLAQVQTLIRLFPRHKEKVLIKWIGFALIVFDTVFSCLNSFVVNNTSRPRDFESAIPALSYLFQLSLELLYGAWVLFYVATKRRYAWYHPKMKNICVVALLSLVAVLTPVAFFVTDIAQPDVDGWGDYFRWVGAAAASVLVWEWVERIEALEREEKKDGILGREIFDGDEMLDVTPSSEVRRAGLAGFHDDGKPRNDKLKMSKPYTTGTRGHGLTNIAHRIAGSRLHPQHAKSNRTEQPCSRSSDKPLMIPLQGNVHNDRPEHTAVSSASCADDASAASPTDAQHHHPVDSPSTVGSRNVGLKDILQNNAGTLREEEVTEDRGVRSDADREFNAAAIRRGVNLRWQAITNQFKRKRDTPPPEIRMAMANKQISHTEAETSRVQPRWHVFSKLASLATDDTEKRRDRSGGRQTEIELPVTIIPAQPRGRTWSPGSLPLSDSSSDRNPSPGVGAPSNEDQNVDHTNHEDAPSPSQATSQPAIQQDANAGMDDALASQETSTSREGATPHGT